MPRPPLHSRQSSATPDTLFPPRPPLRTRTLHKLLWNQRPALQVALRVDVPIALPFPRARARVVRKLFLHLRSP
jgi:hypothetical protein